MQQRATTSCRHVLLIAACAFLPLGTSCFENDDPIDQAAAIVNVSGRWEGATTTGEPVVMILNQTVVTVEGSARVGDLRGNLTGTIDGNRFEATMQTQPVLRIFATVADTTEASTSMSGTVRDISGDIITNFDATPD